MGLETGTYIENLVVSNPTGTDPKSQGDDHLRLLKTTIKNSFPNTAGPWNTTSPITAGAATQGTHLMQLQQQRKISSGYINANGTTGGGSGDFTVVKNAIGSYLINFTDAAPSNLRQAITANAANIISVNCNILLNSATQCQVITTNSGNALDSNFNFIRVIN